MTVRTGYAAADYRTPCPGCKDAIRAGDRVIRIDLPNNQRWWHTDCRREALEVLRRERELV